MRLIEFEAKKLLAEFAIPLPLSQFVTSADQEVTINCPVALKAQVPTGGRKKAGAILFADTMAEVKEGISKLLDMTVNGFTPSGVLVEERASVAVECYVGFTFDAVRKSPVVLFSTEGGIDVEAQAIGNSQSVRKAWFSPSTGLNSDMLDELLPGDITSRTDVAEVMLKLSRMYLETDATVAEINPLAITEDGTVLALDCHADIDDDALSRQSELLDMLGVAAQGGRTGEPTEFEKKAAAIDAADYRGVAGRVIEFDGTLGLIIGGGGASLTTFDAVLSHGGKPANYCEVGGNPSVNKVKELTKLLLSKPNVEKVAVISNIVSNTRADLVARGVIKGAVELGLAPADVISVFRVPGAWEEESIKILTKHGVKHGGRDLTIDEAARLAVAGDE